MRTPKEQALWNALLTVQMLGSIGAITTIEYESGALSDLRHALDLLAPVRAEYTHSARWGDGNGFSHVHCALTRRACRCNSWTENCHRRVPTGGVD